MTTSEALAYYILKLYQAHVNSEHCASIAFNAFKLTEIMISNQSPAGQMSCTYAASVQLTLYSSACLLRPLPLPRPLERPPLLPLPWPSLLPGGSPGLPASAAEPLHQLAMFHAAAAALPPLPLVRAEAARPAREAAQ